MALLGPSGCGKGTLLRGVAGFVRQTGGRVPELRTIPAATGMLPIRMGQDREGKLAVTIAALSGALTVFTVCVAPLMERTTGLTRRSSS